MNKLTIRRSLFPLLFSILMAITPQKGLKYILENRRILGFEKLSFTPEGIELEIPSEKIPAIYSHRREIGFERAEATPVKKGIWKIVLTFKTKEPSDASTVKKEKNKNLTERETKLIETLKKERDYKEKLTIVYKRGKKKEPGARPYFPKKKKTGKKIRTAFLRKEIKETRSRKIPKSELSEGPNNNTLSLSERFMGLSQRAKNELIQPVSVAFKGVPVIAFLDFLSQKTGLSIVPVGDLPGRPLTLFIEDTPLFKVIDIVLMQTGLSMFVESENILIVGSIKKIEELKKNRSLISTLEAGETIVRVIRVKNTNISKIKQTLREVFSKTIKISAIKESGVMVIKGPEKLVTRAEKIIREIDRPRSQILVQAKVIEISENEIRNLGIRWKAAGVSPAGANGTPFTIKTSPGLPPVNGSSSDTIRALSERPVFSQNLRIGIPYNIASLELSLSALEKKGKAKVIAEPSVTLEEGTEGQILQTKEIPYSYVNNWLANVSFRQAGLILKVTPYIVDIQRKLVKLRVKVESSTPDFGNPVNGLPPIDRQGVEVVNVIKDGEFQILGGLKVKRTSSSRNGVPVLSSIPLIKHLFRNNDRRSDNYELLILIRPKIQLM